MCWRSEQNQVSHGENRSFPLNETLQGLFAIQWDATEQMEVVY